MKSRLATRYFMIFGGISALALALAALLMLFYNARELERARLSLYRRSADTLAAVAGAVLNGREDARAMRSALSFAEGSLQARVVVLADAEKPFTRFTAEPILGGARRQLEDVGESVYIRNYSYQGAPYRLYAAALPEGVGAVVILDPMDGAIAAARERAFLTTLAVLGIALVMLFFIGAAASRESAPIVALKNAAEKLKAGEDADDIAVGQQENELGTLGEVFNSMKAAFQKELRARDDFTANISHDLRTPLTSIRGFTQGMLDGVIKPDEYRRTLEIILREVKHMIRLTGDILEIAKIDSGRLKLNKEYVDVSELLQEILEGLAGSFGDVRRSFAAGDNVGVMADRGRLMQVFTNIIVNAFKYNRPGGEVSVHVSRKAKAAEITVSDTGVGMAEADLSRIFEKFFRADKSRTGSKDGTGIGLYVVKRLLEMHGANIAYASTPGEGTVVKVELPL